MKKRMPRPAPGYGDNGMGKNGSLMKQFKTWGNTITNRKNVGYLFIFPALLDLFIFVAIPLIAAFYIALTDLDIFLQSPNFVGQSNFTQSFQDERVWNAFKNTAVYVGVNVPLQLGLALILAFLLSKPTRFNKLCRTVFYVPVLCSFTAIAILFQLLLNSTVGYIPYMISWFTGTVESLLSSPRWAMPVVIAISVWKNFGRSLIIYVAGILDIPQTYFEASAIDGASRTQQFFRITIPNLLPTISFTLLTTIISSFQVFDAVYVTTGGGPLHKTETVVQYIYLRGFSDPYDLGYASAVCVELFTVIAVITLFFKGYLDRRIEKNY